MCGVRINTLLTYLHQQIFGGVVISEVEFFYFSRIFLICLLSQKRKMIALMLQNVCCKDSMKGQLPEIRPFFDFIRKLSKIPQH